MGKKDTGTLCVRLYTIGKSLFIFLLAATFLYYQASAKYNMFCNSMILLAGLPNKLERIELCSDEAWDDAKFGLGGLQGDLE